MQSEFSPLTLRGKRIKFITQPGPLDELVFVKKNNKPNGCVYLFWWLFSTAPSNPLSRLLNPALFPRRLNFTEWGNGLLASSLGFGWHLLIEVLSRWSEGRRRETGAFTIPVFFLEDGCFPLPKAQPHPVASPTSTFGAPPCPFRSRGGNGRQGAFIVLCWFPLTMPILCKQVFP